MHANRYTFHGHNGYLIHPRTSQVDHTMLALGHTSSLQPWRDPVLHAHTASEELYCLLGGELRHLKDLTDKLVLGDPTTRNVYNGPVINKSSYNDFKEFTEEISQGGGNLLTGGKVRTDGDYGKGFVCESTFVTDLPFEHRLWKHEMFLPITTIGKGTTLTKP